MVSTHLSTRRRVSAVCLLLVLQAVLADGVQAESVTTLPVGTGWLDLDTGQTLTVTPGDPVPAEADVAFTSGATATIVARDPSLPIASSSASFEEISFSTLPALSLIEAGPAGQPLSEPAVVRIAVDAYSEGAYYKLEAVAATADSVTIRWAPIDAPAEAYYMMANPASQPWFDLDTGASGQGHAGLDLVFYTGPDPTQVCANNRTSTVQIAPAPEPYAEVEYVDAVYLTPHTDLNGPFGEICGELDEVSVFLTPEDRYYKVGQYVDIRLPGDDWAPHDMYFLYAELEPPPLPPDGITLGFEQAWLDLETGEVGIGDFGAPGASFDINFVYNGSRIPHAVLFQNQTSGVELAFTDDDFDGLTWGRAVALPFTTELIDAAFERVAVVRTPEGHYFKVALIAEHPLQNSLSIRFSPIEPPAPSSDPSSFRLLVDWLDLDTGDKLSIEPGDPVPPAADVAFAASPSAEIVVISRDPDLPIAGTADSYDDIYFSSLPALSFDAAGQALIPLDGPKVVRTAAGPTDEGAYHKLEPVSTDIDEGRVDIRWAQIAAPLDASHVLVDPADQPWFDLETGVSGHGQASLDLVFYSGPDPTVLCANNRTSTVQIAAAPEPYEEIGYVDAVSLEPATDINGPFGEICGTLDAAVFLTPEARYYKVGRYLEIPLSSDVWGRRDMYFHYKELLPPPPSLGYVSGYIRTLRERPVEGVVVHVEPPTGKALRFDDGDDRVDFGREAVLGQYSDTNELTLEYWVYPTSSSPGTILSRGAQEDGAIAVRIEAGRRIAHEVRTGGTWSTVTSNFDPDTWNHFAMTCDGDSLRLYRNGTAVDATPVSGTLELSAAALYAGAAAAGPGALQGLLDEVRLWSVARSAEQIADARTRTTVHGEAGLIGDWSFDEGMGTIAFDRSGHDIYGRISGATWASTGAPVMVAAATDPDGHYEVRGVNFDSTGGTHLRVIPSKPLHAFQPVTTDRVTLDRYQSGVDGLNFSDTAVLTVSGSVRYAGTQCAAAGVDFLLAGGRPAVPPIRTDADGRYVADFDPGASETLSPSLQDHLFVPASYEFESLDRHLTQDFVDSTARNLTVSVRGGLCNAAIGEFDVTVTAIGGCIETTGRTTGGRFDFSQLPPLEYMVTVEPGDSLAQSIVWLDSTFGDVATQSVSLADTSASLAIVYRSAPRVRITGLPAPYDKTGNASCGSSWPFEGDEVTVVQQGASYALTIEAFEPYGQTECLLDSGSVSITDRIGGRDVDGIDLENGRASFELIPRQPNLAPPYDWTLEATLVDPEQRQATGSVRAFVAGRRAREATFATTSPEIPFLVLHDPPGDRSYSYLSESTQTSTSVSLLTRAYNTSEAWATTRLGPDYTVFGVSIDNTVDLGTGLSLTTSFASETESQVSLTTETTYATSQEDQIVGPDADLFVGGALNLVYGLTDVLGWDEGTCQLISDEEIFMEPRGFATTYQYTANEIVNQVIPNLQALADAHPDSSAIYEPAVALWQGVLDQNAANRAAATPVTNLSFNAGASVESTHEEQRSSTNVFAFDVDLSAYASGETGVTVNGIGGQIGFQHTVGIQIGGSTTTQNVETTRVGYVLSDDDEKSDLNLKADNFTVDVKTDPVYGTPVFELRSGRSSCPWEPGTAPREGVRLDADVTVANGIESGQPAVFPLRLVNTSQTDEDRTYHLSVVQSTNPDGATVRLNGVPVEGHLSFDVPAGEPMEAVMTLDRGPTAHDYEGVEIQLASPCDDGAGPADHLFASSVSFDAHFLQACDGLTVQQPAAGWIVTTGQSSLETALTRIASDHPGLEGFDLQIAGDDNQWLTVAETDAATIGEAQVVHFTWELPAEWPDGTYRIRGRSRCGASTAVTPEVAGGVDRHAPQLLSQPQPVDGILSIDDEISAEFSEAIDCGSINASQIVLNNVTSGQPVPASWTCSGSRLVVSPETHIPNREIENATIQATLTGIKDLAGSTLSEPVSWSFTVDRNPVVWVNGQLDVVKYEGEPAVARGELRNRGAAVRDFQIDGPEWLSVFPERGQIAPFSAVEVLFEVSEFVNYGIYEARIEATAIEGAEPLQLHMRALPPLPPWSVDPSRFEYSMNMTGELSIRGELADDPYHLIGAFVDGECRGVGSVQRVVVPPDTTYQVYLTVYSNQVYDPQQPETVSLRVWNAIDGEEYANITAPVAFVDETTSGTPRVPLAWNATGEVFQRIDLTGGWHWVSFNIRRPDMSLGSILGSLAPAEGDQIKAVDVFAVYDSLSGTWTGSLAEVDNTSMYMMRLAETAQLETFGDPIELSAEAVDVYAGWNWIGFPPRRTSDVNEALADFNASADDLIKSQLGFAQYVEGVGWFGNLTHLEPGRGYKLQAHPLPQPGDPPALVDQFTYPAGPTPAPRMLAGMIDADIELPGDWQVQPRAFENNMTITARLLLEDGLYEGQDIVLAAFVGDQCRGVAQPRRLPSTSATVFFLMVHSDDEDELEFRIYEGATGRSRPLFEQMPFASDAVIGAVTKPYLFTAAGPARSRGVPETCVLEPNHPNPFNPETQIIFGLPTAGRVRIDVHNVVGQRIRQLVSEELSAGFHSISWDGADDDGRPVRSGVYLYRMTAGEFVDTRKMLLLR